MYRLTDRLSFMRQAVFCMQEEKEMCAIPVIDMVKTGQNIVILRKRAGLSVRDLQEAFGFGTPQAIYKWQQGLALPTIDNLVALAALLSVTMIVDLHMGVRFPLATLFV